MRLKLALLAMLLTLVAVPVATQAKPRVEYRMVGSWGGPHAFAYPGGIDADLRGDVYVADSRNHRIVKFSPSGKRLSVFGSEEIFGGWPNDVAVSASGDLFVAVDTGGVVRLSGSGEVEGRWGEYEGTAANRPPGALIDPSGIAVDSAGHVYVSDDNLDAILVYAEDGSFQDHWTGEHFPLPNGRFEPFGLDTDPAGYLYVANGLGGNVIKLTTTGEFVKSWGRLKLGQDWNLGIFQFGFMVEDVATGPHSAVFASDLYSPRIHRFSASGRGIVQWRTPGPKRPRVRAITAGPRGDVFALTDRRVYRYKASRARPPRPDIRRAPRLRTSKSIARFRFRLRGWKSRFRCQLTGVRVPRKFRRWRSCASPVTYRNLRPGLKRFRVRAVASGLSGRPSAHRWRVLR